MYETIYGLLESWMNRQLAQLVTYILCLAIVTIVCIAAFWVVRYCLIRVLSVVAKRTKNKWDDILLEHNVHHRIAFIAVPFVLSSFAAGLPQYGGLLGKVAQVAGVVVFTLVVTSLLTAVNSIYNQYEISKTRPIHSLIQIVQVAIYILAGIVVIALLLGENPLVLLGSIGAATAVTSFIFKDAILGFIAGVQLTSNDMIRIGDWIEMPGSNADGTVVELTMTTVKVQNFDKTITSVPAYTLVSQAFINWRGMEAAGGRRIKRSIYIDAGDVRLADDEMIERFRRMDLLKEYMDAKLVEIDAFNNAQKYDTSEVVNGRRITNLGTFRAYMLEYIKRHPGIHPDMIAMVRQRDPEDKGIPLEIYAFTRTTAWEEYENIQSDIFDHLYSVVSQFGLHIYQQPSGADIRSLEQK